MPTWLLLALVIAGFVLWTGLLAAAHTGHWRTLWEASKQFAWHLLALAALGILAAVSMYLWPPTP
jgi:hypothetical protein